MEPCYKYENVFQNAILYVANAFTFVVVVAVVVCY